MCNSDKQGERKRVEVELFEDIFDQVGGFVAFVDAIEGVAGGFRTEQWRSVMLRRGGGSAIDSTSTSFLPLRIKS